MDDNSPRGFVVEHSLSSDHSDIEPQSPLAVNGIPRAKRKKARRACLACQRAHLTCGDERPCQRCIKRGLQDSCHDGKRKKAKYLHDASDEVLATATGGTFLSSKSRSDSTGNIETSNSPHSTHYDRRPTISTISGSIRSPDIESAPNQMRGGQVPAFQDESGTQQSQRSPAMDTNYTSLYENNDPSMFNFDLASMNFGNHYGALEFGMLGHLSSGADEALLQHENSHHSSVPFDTTNMTPSMFLDTYGSIPAGSVTDWQANLNGHGLQMNTWNRNGQPSNYPIRHSSGHIEPYAYAIGAVVKDASAQSPPQNFLDRSIRGNDRNMAESGLLDNVRSTAQITKQQRIPGISTHEQMRHHGPSEDIAKKLGNAPRNTVTTRKRRRNPGSIYSSVTKPYPYTLGFHALTAYLQRRFSSQKRLAIAQALASIRPSFISCTRTLIDDDLVFMEKCFQRQLVEYEDFIGACGTPTIVCRRTGEIAYAGEEFSLLSGWTHDVLLGKSPNLNTNRFDLSGAVTATSSRNGVSTPHTTVDANRSEAPDTAQSPQQQAIFLAELLDDDSVVRFYEDFAKLAFADSKGSAWCHCKLLKYQNKVENNLDLSISENKFLLAKQDQASSHDSSAKISVMGSRNKTFVECMYCWTVRRDVFDIPSLLVFSFLPIISE